MSVELTENLNIIAQSALELELLDGDLNIIQALDDEPNDVGGLTSAQLKAKFDEGSNVIKTYLNGTLIPAILAADATEAARAAAEAAREQAEAERRRAEAARSISRTNLLDNWYLADPINQRGQTAYAKSGAAFQYTVDRWKMYGGTVTVADGATRFTSGRDAAYKRFLQVVDTPLRAGSTYTLSVFCNVRELSGKNWLRFANSAYAGIAQTLIPHTGAQVCTLSVTPTESLESFCVELLCGNEAADVLDVELYAWKLELGPNQTLAVRGADGGWALLDPPPNRALELEKCQRYQVVIGNDSASVLCGDGYILSASDAKKMRIFIPTPVTMRCAGTPTFSEEISLGGLEVYGPEVSSNPVTSLPSTLYLSGNGVFLMVTLANSAKIGSGYNLRVGANRRLILDANL